MFFFCLSLDLCKFTRRYHHCWCHQLLRQQIPKHWPGGCVWWGLRLWCWQDVGSRVCGEGWHHYFPSGTRRLFYMLTDLAFCIVLLSFPSLSCSQCIGSVILLSVFLPSLFCFILCVFQNAVLLLLFFVIYFVSVSKGVSIFYWIIFVILWFCPVFSVSLLLTSLSYFIWNVYIMLAYHDYSVFYALSHQVRN